MHLALRQCALSSEDGQVEGLQRLHERLREAARLAQEVAVQAAAIEAAMSNVEHHYSYICTHFKDFTAWCASF